MNVCKEGVKVMEEDAITITTTIIIIIIKIIIKTAIYGSMMYLKNEGTTTLECLMVMDGALFSSDK